MEGVQQGPVLVGTFFRRLGALILGVTVADRSELASVNSAMTLAPSESQPES